MPSRALTPNEQRVSAQLVRLVQVVFGFVLAQSFGLYREVVLRPWAREHRLEALALLGVYVTTILSWVDWHGTITRRPYVLGDLRGVRTIEQLRFGADLFVVSIYAFTLFAVGELASAGAELYVFGYVAMFVGYIASGVLRRRTYGRVASNLRPMFVFGAVAAVAWLTLVAFDANGWGGGRARSWAGVFGALLAMAGFRLLHTHERVRWRARHQSPT